MPINWNVVDPNAPRTLANIFNPEQLRMREARLQGAQEQARGMELQNIQRQQQIQEAQRQQQIAPQLQAEEQRKKMELYSRQIDSSIANDLRAGMDRKLVAQRAANRSKQLGFSDEQITQGLEPLRSIQDNKQAYEHYLFSANPELAQKEQVKRAFEQPKKEKPTEWVVQKTAEGLVQVNPVTGQVRKLGLKGKVDQKLIESQKKEEKREASKLERSELVINTIDNALGKTGLFTTGLIGSVAGEIPGTTAYDLRRDIDTIKASIGFGELQAMREASPTGGALGQVAVQELTMLQAVLGSLDPNQSDAEISRKLNQVRQHYEKWKNTIEQARAGKTQTSKDEEWEDL